MPTTTPIQGLPIPILSDVANVPLHVQNLAQALEKQLAMVFASAAARTTAIPTPVAGMLSFRLDARAWEYYDATPAAWVPLFPTRIQQTTFNTDLASGATGAEVIGYSQAASLITGRRYRVHVSAPTNGSATIPGLLRVRYATGAVTTASTQAGAAVIVSNGGGGANGRNTMSFFREFVATSTASWNIAIGVAAIGSAQETIVSATTGFNTEITVDDVGV